MFFEFGDDGISAHTSVCRFVPMGETIAILAWKGDRRSVSPNLSDLEDDDVHEPRLDEAGVLHPVRDLISCTGPLSRTLYLEFSKEGATPLLSFGLDQVT